MGIPAWVWFAVAVIAALGGMAMLARDRAVRATRNRERRRWATLRGWHFTEVDPALPTQWRGGALGYFGGTLARDVVAGSTFTADGRRRVYVFDLDSGGKVSTVVVAVQCRLKHPVVIELWLPSVPFEQEHMPELLGPVGQRYAFVSDLAKARLLITPDLVDATDDLGDDIMVTWVENGWVLATAAPNTGPSRLERLIRGVGEIADVVDPLDAPAAPPPVEQPHDIDL